MTSTPGLVTHDSVPLLDLYNPVNTDFDFNAKDPANSGPYRILNKQKQTGVYVQDQAQWDKVLVTLGGRYDWADQAISQPRSGNRPINVMTNSLPGVVVLTTCLIMA